MKRMLSIAIIIIFSELLYSQTLIIEAEGFRNDQGLARIAVFNTAEGFPDKLKDRKYSGSVKIIQGKASIMFPEIDYRSCAVSVLHDEDMDEKIKLGFMGIPQEGYGLSREARGLFGPPKYEDAVVTINKALDKIKIKVIY